MEHIVNLNDGGPVSIQARGFAGYDSQAGVVAGALRRDRSGWRPCAAYHRRLPAAMQSRLRRSLARVVESTYLNKP